MRVVVSQFQGIDATPALPLAAGCLIAAARADEMLAGRCTFEIAFQRQAIADAVAELGAAGAPDVLGFSLYPWNAAYSLAVAAAARVAFPGCLMVAGGPWLPRRPERASDLLDGHPALDVLVFSEGELSFPALLRAHLAGRGLSRVGGIGYRRPGAHRGHGFTAPPERVRDFSALPSPFLDGTFDALCATHRDRFAMALLESNRGCPFSCTFCDWSLTKHVVEFPEARVRAELAWAARQGFPLIMMADANFGIRRRDAEIARYLAELRRDTGMPRSFYFYLTKNDHGRNLEIIDILQRADIGTWVGLAVQDFDDEVLAAVKRDNIQTEESRKLRDICGERDIATFNELIFGLPGQSYESFTRTVAQAMADLPRHGFVIFFCRLIDNTELGAPESRERHAIDTRRCAWRSSIPGQDGVLDEVQEVVVGTRDMPLAEWRRAYGFAFLAAALYNMRLLRVVLRHLGAMGVDRREYMAHLVQGMGRGDEGSVYRDMGRVMTGYLESMLGCGPLALPAYEGAGAPVAYVDEAVAGCALRRYDEFLAETRALTREFVVRERGPLGAGAALALDEAFRYQGLIVPRWGCTEARVEVFEHDWPAYMGSGRSDARLAPRRVRVAYEPPPYTGLGSLDDFVTVHLSCMQLRLDAGRIESAGREEGAVAASPMPVREAGPGLVVLS